MAHRCPAVLWLWELPADPPKFNKSKKA